MRPTNKTLPSAFVDWVAGNGEVMALHGSVVYSNREANDVDLIVCGDGFMRLLNSEFVFNRSLENMAEDHYNPDGPVFNVGRLYAGDDLVRLEVWDYGDNWGDLSECIDKHCESAILTVHGLFWNGDYLEGVPGALRDSRMMIIRPVHLEGGIYYSHNSVKYLENKLGGMIADGWTLAESDYNTDGIDVKGPLFMWRRYSILRDKDRKFVIKGGHSIDWPEKYMRAKCHVFGKWASSDCFERSHLTSSHTCGIYGYLDSKVVQHDYTWGHVMNFWTRCLVWGDVFEYSDGLRVTDCEVVEVIGTEEALDVVRDIWGEEDIVYRVKG